MSLVPDGPPYREALAASMGFETSTRPPTERSVEPQLTSRPQLCSRLEADSDLFRCLRRKEGLAPGLCMS